MLSILKSRLARTRSPRLLSSLPATFLQPLEPRLLLSTAHLGVNLEAVGDANRSFMFADAMKSARPFGSPNTPWDEAATLDAQGWPIGDAGATVIMLDNTGPAPIHIDGTYRFSATGDITLSPVSTNAVVLNRLYDPATDTTTADLVVLPGAEALHINFTGDPDGAKNIRLFRPGTIPGQTFTPEFLQSLEGAQTLRLMDFTRANTTNVTEWDQRARPSDARQSNPDKGAAWEYAIELANTLDKNLWVNVPAGASDDYVRKMADLFHDTLEPGRQIYLEYSNEVWNSGYWRQFWTNYGEAQKDIAANPADLNYDNANNDYMFAWRRIAKRLIELRDIFAAEYGPGSINTTIRPVLGSQIGWAYVLNDQLSYLRHRFGVDLSDEIYAVAGAPYMSLDGALSDSPSLTVDQIIDGLRQNLEYMQPGIQRFEALAVEHRLNYLFYEGGIDIQGNTAGNFLSAKLPANYDPRLAALVREYLINAFNNGVDGVMYYGHISAYTSWGTWGLTDSVQALDAPKMLGFRSVAAEETPPVTTGIAPAPAFGHVSFDAGSFLMDMWGSRGNGGSILGTSGGSHFTYLLNVTSSTSLSLQLSTSTHGAPGLVEVFVDGISVGQLHIPPTAAFATTAPLNLTDLFGGSLTPGHHSLRIRVPVGPVNIQSLTIGSGGYVAPHPPLTPANVTAASAGTSEIKLAWIDVAGETSYRLERSTDGATWAEIALLPANSAAYTDAGLPSAKKYFYRLRACNAAGDSPFSTPTSASTAPLPPASLTATADSPSAITLSWSPVPGVASYLIQRTQNGKSTWTTLTRVGRNATSFTDYGLTANTAYSYRIFAVSLDGTLSQPSPTATARTRNKLTPALRHLAP